MVLPDYQNVDSWWQWFKRRPPWLRIAVGVFLVVLGILITWQHLSKRGIALENDRLEAEKASLARQNQQLRTDRDSLAQELNAVRTKEAELHRENLHQKELLDPIRRKAEQLYPAIDTDAALVKLVEDVEQVRELATRDIFKPLATSIRAEVLGRLHALQAEYPGVKITVHADLGNRPRTLLADELVSILVAAGFQAERGPPVIVFTQDASPIKVSLHPDDLAVANKIAEAIRPFMTGAFRGELKEELSRGVLVLTILGDPLFSADGAVTFK